MTRFTLGMATYDDFDGVYFSCQANRMLHPLIDKEGEILVVDNNPSSKSGIETRDFCERSGVIRYAPYQERISTAVRSRIFTEAKGEIVICIDCHVLLLPGAIEAIINLLSESNPEGPRLVQGPIVTDDLKTETSQWVDGWRRGLHGTWDVRRPIQDNTEIEPFEIPSMGLGAFAARKDEWLDFNPLFRGFGGEEGYIHRKYRLRGGKAICLPAFKWIHRFHRPLGTPYPMRSADRIFNYFIGAFELKEPVDRILEYFIPFHSEWELRLIYDEAKKAFFE